MTGAPNPAYEDSVFVRSREILTQSNAPGFFRDIKTAVDARRGQNGLFVLTGSQNFLLMERVADSPSPQGLPDRPTRPPRSLEC